jgi:DNA-binding response OmpR family regulator
MSGLIEIGNRSLSIVNLPLKHFPQPKEALMHSSSQRILCVDDHNSRNLAVYLLERAHYEVMTASSLAEGLELAKSIDFDLFLINSGLYQASAKEACNRLNETKPNTPCLVYCSSSGSYIEHRPIPVGKDNLLKDPVDIAEVVPNVHKILDRKGIAATHN